MTVQNPFAKKSERIYRLPLFTYTEMRVAVNLHGHHSVIFATYRKIIVWTKIVFSQLYRKK